MEGLFFYETELFTLLHRIVPELLDPPAFLLINLIELASARLYRYKGNVQVIRQIWYNGALQM